MIVLIRIQDTCAPLPLRSRDNFDSICVCLHGHELFRIGLCSFKLVVGRLGGGGGFRWVVSVGFGWLWMVSGGLLF